jgi:hypothetical protein
MGCKYSDYNGKCNFFDGVMYIGGCDKEGNCECEDDENPEDTCLDFESDEDEEF